jgi:hypothetical protein
MKMVAAEFTSHRMCTGARGGKQVSQEEERSAAGYFRDRETGNEQPMPCSLSRFCTVIAAPIFSDKRFERFLLNKAFRSFQPLEFRIISEQPCR